MEKVIIQKDLFSLPWTQTILGTHHQGKPNFMALDWLTRTNYQPAMLGICVNKRNLSHAAILETGVFSINVPTVDMVEITDYTGIVSGKNVNKSILFEVFYGELKAAPMISLCPLTLECKLYKTVDLPTNSFFIGEIVDIYSEKKYLMDGKPDVEKIKPFLLTMPDNRYWSVGECVGHAWMDGLNLRERLEQKKQS